MSVVSVSVYIIVVYSINSVFKISSGMGQMFSMTCQIKIKKGPNLKNKREIKRALVCLANSTF